MFVFHWVVDVYYSVGAAVVFYDGDWHVDTGDLVILAENWLWIACWKLEELTEAMAMSGGESAQSESMMIQPLTMDAFAVESQPTAATVEPQPEVPVEPEPEPAPEPEPEPAPEPEPEPEVPVEPQPEVSPDTLVEIIDFLDEVLVDQPDNAENIVDMRAFLIDQLEAILEQ